MKDLRLDDIIDDEEDFVYEEKVSWTKRYKKYNHKKRGSRHPVLMMVNSMQPQDTQMPHIHVVDLSIFPAISRR